MYIKKDDLRKQILISLYEFRKNEINVSLSLNELSLENCPIDLEDFESYDGIPRGISPNVSKEKLQEEKYRKEWLDNLKSFFFSKGANYICFIGISEKAMQNA